MNQLGVSLIYKQMLPCCIFAMTIKKLPTVTVKIVYAYVLQMVLLYSPLNQLMQMFHIINIFGLLTDPHCCKLNPNYNSSIRYGLKEMQASYSVYVLVVVVDTM